MGKCEAFPKTTCALINCWVFYSYEGRCGREVSMLKTKFQNLKYISFATLRRHSFILRDNNVHYAGNTLEDLIVLKFRTMDDIYNEFC